MNQTSIIGAALVIGYAVFVIYRGELPCYLQTLGIATATNCPPNLQPAGCSSTGSSSSSSSSSSTTTKTCAGVQVGPFCLPLTVGLGTGGRSGGGGSAPPITIGIGGGGLGIG